MTTDGDVRSRLHELARIPVLLVGCDYDGTLAPIVENPDLAHPNLESVAALRHLASLPDTHVAVISGRSLRDLAALSRLPAEIHLVGSHGSEFDAGFTRDLSDEQLELLHVIADALDSAATAGPGFSVEAKPASIAFHYRRADPATAAPVVDRILDGVARTPGVEVKLGKMVVELAVIDTDKGTAIEQLRRQTAADAVIFVGDDITDEDAFAVLHGADLGIKVGPGDTRAQVRIDDTDEVANQLELLCEMRAEWLDGNAPTL